LTQRQAGLSGNVELASASSSAFTSRAGAQQRGQQDPSSLSQAYKLVGAESSGSEADKAAKGGLSAFSVTFFDFSTF